MHTWPALAEASCLRVHVWQVFEISQLIAELRQRHHATTNSSVTTTNVISVKPRASESSRRQRGWAAWTRHLQVQLAAATNTACCTPRHATADMNNSRRRWIIRESIGRCRRRFIRWPRPRDRADEAEDARPGPARSVGVHVCLITAFIVALSLIAGRVYRQLYQRHAYTVHGLLETSKSFSK